MRILMLLMALLIPCTAEATKYWASPGASSSTACASISGTSDPGSYRSMLGAIGCAAAGDTIHLKAGTYNEARINDVVPNGISSSLPTILEGEGALGCAIAGTCNTIINRDSHNFAGGTNITIRNLKITGQTVTSGASCIRVTDPAYEATGVSADSTSNFLIDNVELAYCYLHGVFTQSGVNAFTIRSSNIHHTNQGLLNIGGHGCYLEGTSIIEDSEIHDITVPTSLNSLGCQIIDTTNPGTVDNSIVRRNKFYNLTSSHALYMQGANNLVYDNLFYNTLRAFELSPGTASNGGCNTGLKFLNNTVYNNTIGLILGNTFGSSTGCEGLTADFSNNIIIANPDTTEFNWDAVGVPWTSTGTKNAGDCGTTCGSSPVTIAAITSCTVSTSDFHLKSATTACNDAGANLSSTLTTDIEGTPRPQGTAFDIGAYEYLVSGPPAATNPTWSPAGNLRLAP